MNTIGTDAGIIWRTFCGLALAQAGGVNLEDMLKNLGSKWALENISFHQTKFLDTEA